MALKTDPINSLVLIDEGGGHITAATYESLNPLDRTLNSFSMDLPDIPNLGNHRTVPGES